MKPIYIVLRDAAEKLPTGASRFWGNPDLPEGMAFPMFEDDEGDDYPYTFVCQINLADIATLDEDNCLPHEGLLSFFAKIDTYMGIDAAAEPVGGCISGPEAVKVLYFPATGNLREVVLVDDDDEPVAPEEMAIGFSRSVAPLSDDHALLALPTHRQWEAWDSPFEDRVILLQVDSFEGKDFDLNFMDCGVLDFLISPDDLKERNFSDVRGIVLST